MKTNNPSRKQLINCLLSTRTALLACSIALLAKELGCSDLCLKALNKLAASGTAAVAKKGNVVEVRGVVNGVRICVRLIVK